MEETFFPGTEKDLCPYEGEPRIRTGGSEQEKGGGHGSLPRGHEDSECGSHS